MLVFSSGSFIGGSHVCIVSVFLSIPTFQAFYFIDICMCVYLCVCDKGHCQTSVYFLPG
jgi:hypothetical protein